MLAQPVKASAVTHLTDARYFAAWEVDYLGFDLGPDGVSAHELAAMLEWVQGPKMVGELDAGLPARIAAGIFNAQQLEELPLDAFQVDAIFGADSVKEHLVPLNRPVLLELTVEGYADIESLEDTLQAYGELASVVILNFKKGGIRWEDLLAGQPFSFEALAPLAKRHELWLEIDGAAPGEIKAALPELRGFSVRGGSEEKVGFKDFDDLADFFEDLEVEGE